MSNIKVTAALLESAGWSEPQVARYYKLLTRKQAHGLSSLSISDRRFYNSAAVACNKAQTAISKALSDGLTRRVSGKQPVETKLHYRFCLADMLNFQDRAELLPGEELAIVIIRQEQMRALELYQPVLDQVDTVRRVAFSTGTEVELLELAAALGRALTNYDSLGHQEALRKEFEVTWNDRWDEYYGRTTCNPVALGGDDALAFRAEVRPVIEQFTRSLPSVAQAVAA
jgi:hypothetical protein